MTRPFAARALPLAVAAARSAGLDPAGAALLRVVSAVHVELPRAGVVARVETPDAGDTAERQVWAARLLEDRGVPAARLAAPGGQPIVLDGGIVTLWRQLEIDPGAPGPELVGEIARRLHDATSAEELPPATPALDPFEPLDRWLDRPLELPPPAGTGRLRQRLDRLRAGWPAVVATDRPGACLAHGDLNADNVVLTAGDPTLIDLEMAGRGPAAWDLAPQRVAVRRYGAPAADYRRFCAGYGGDPLARDPDAELLIEVYELHLAAWSIGHRDTSPEMAAEAELRLAGVLGESDRPWTLL